MTNRHYLLSFFLLAILLLTSCKQSTVYYHYENTPEGGWEKNDLLTFETNRMSDDAIYQEELALRISNKYPFMRLRLIVEQTIYPAGAISQYQYTFPLKDQQLHRGDSLHLSVHHDMKREILPGITGIGIKVKKK